MTDVDSFLPARAEVLIIKFDVVFASEELRCLAHEIMLLMNAVEKRARKCLKAILARIARRLSQTPCITHAAAAVGQTFG